MATGTDVQAPSKKELEVAYSAILEGTEIPQADPGAVSQAILERLSKAETFEEVFSEDDDKLPGWQTYVGQPVTILGFKLNPSTQAREDGDPSVYAVVDLVIRETGEAVTVSCGGRNVLMQLVKALEHGWFKDHTYRLISKPTAGGNTVLWLQAVED